MPVGNAFGNISEANDFFGSGLERSGATRPRQEGEHTSDGCLRVKGRAVLRNASRLRLSLQRVIRGLRVVLPPESLPRTPRRRQRMPADVGAFLAQEARRSQR